MTIENTTTRSPAATISEKELWSIFVNNVVNTSLGAGTVIERYKPDDYLRHGDVHEDLDGFTNHIADGLSADQNPRRMLEEVIRSMKSYLGKLKVIKSDIDMLADTLTIGHDDDGFPILRTPTVNKDAA